MSNGTTELLAGLKLSSFLIVSTPTSRIRTFSDARKSSRGETSVNAVATREDLLICKVVRYAVPVVGRKAVDDWNRSLGQHRPEIVLAIYRVH